MVNRYRGSGHKITSLVLTASSGGRGKSRLISLVEKIISATIDELYLSKQKHKASYVIQEAQRRCYSAGVGVPAKSTIRIRINKLSGYEKQKAREGIRAARTFAPIYGSFPEPEYPLAVFQIDHTKVDLIINASWQRISC